MKKYLLFLVLSVALLPTSVWGQANLSQIDSLIKRMLPEASEVGISVYDWQRRSHYILIVIPKLSRPASTMKLLTAITASPVPMRTILSVRKYGTTVIEHDTLQGNLYVVGGFDPEFDSLMMDSLIEEVITFPFSVINGQVYGDVSMKDSLYWGHGWAWDDTPELISLICLRWCFVRVLWRWRWFPALCKEIRQAFPVSLCLLIIPWRTGQRHVLLLPEVFVIKRLVDQWE